MIPLRRTLAAAALASALAGPALAQSASETMAVQAALAWTGHYDGPIDGRARPATRTSVARFQRDSGFRATGRLSAGELGQLLGAADAARAAAGYEAFADAQTEITIGIPRALAPRMEQSEQGTRFLADDDRVTIELVRVAGADLAGFLRAMMASHPNLRVTYAAGGRSWFVVTGFVGERQFYSRARLDPPGMVAFAVTYDGALERRVEPAIVAMSSAFARPHILSMIAP